MRVKGVVVVGMDDGQRGVVVAAWMRLKGGCGSRGKGGVAGMDEGPQEGSSYDST